MQRVSGAAGIPTPVQLAGVVTRGGRAKTTRAEEGHEAHGARVSEETRDLPTGGHLLTFPNSTFSIQSSPKAASGTEGRWTRGL